MALQRRVDSCRGELKIMFGGRLETKAGTVEELPQPAPITAAPSCPARPDGLARQWLARSRALNMVRIPANDACFVNQLWTTNLLKAMH